MTTITVRIDEQLKVRAKNIFAQKGLSISAAVRHFLQNESKKKVIIPEKVVDRWKRESQEALEDGQGFVSAEELHADILKQ